MIIFTINQPNHKYPISFESPEEVGNFLWRKFEPQLAIDAQSWCELACVGEVYDADNRFTIEVEDI